MQAGSYSVPTPVAAIVVLVVLLIGVAAGRAKSRWTLLVAGLVAALGVAIVLTAVAGGPAGDAPAAEITALYELFVPIAVAFLAGWFAARGSWLSRLLVIAAAAVLLAFFPYAAAGQATADSLLESRGVEP